MNAQALKKLGIILFSFSILFAVADIIYGVYGHYQYTKNYDSYWNLADKASTIPQKSEYIDKFVNALANSPLTGEYNAVIFTTPDNSFDKNFEALKSLQLRLREIQQMDVKSFEYNTAIQQITSQEQGEAAAMLGVFSGVWWKTNYFLLWDWVCAINVLIIVAMFVFGIRYWNYGNW